MLTSNPMNGKGYTMCPPKPKPQLFRLTPFDYCELQH